MEKVRSLQLSVVLEMNLELQEGGQWEASAPCGCLQGSDDGCLCSLASCNSCHHPNIVSGQDKGFCGHTSYSLYNIICITSV